MASGIMNQCIAAPNPGPTTAQSPTILLTDEQVLTHYRTSEKVKTPYGLRVISQADGSLLPGHSGVYCYGGSWFLNDAANYVPRNRWLPGVSNLTAKPRSARSPAIALGRISRCLLTGRFWPWFTTSRVTGWTRTGELKLG